MSKDVVDACGLVGTGMEAAGVGMMCTVVAAPEGVIFAEAGAGISSASSLTAIAIDFINGDYKEGIDGALWYIWGRKVKDVIHKLATKTSISEGIEKLGEEILRRGYEASQGFVQSAISIAEKRKDNKNNDEDNL